MFWEERLWLQKRRWIGTRQPKGRAVLAISRLPALPALDPRSLTTAQLDHADEIFEHFRNQDMLSANEDWRDKIIPHYANFGLAWLLAETTLAADSRRRIHIPSHDVDLASI